uniref:Dedicator of cytokinesis protein 11 n=1 Tax=Schistocephalus solidus TaxID=70667 RepID=A0A0V0J8H6_SCHSO
MRQRKFVQHLVQGSSNALKSSENSVSAEDTFENFQITCVSEPLDYEQYLVRNKASILNDPHRDLIIFPQDELMVLPLKRNTIHPSGCLPASSTLAELSAKSALARQVSADLTSNEWPFLYQPQLIYRGNFSVVPRDRKVKEVISTPVNQWYAIDHQRKTVDQSNAAFSRPVSGESGAPAALKNGNASVNSKTGSGAASRSWTTAVASVRRAAASGGMRVGGNGDSEPASRRTSATICLECKGVVCSRSEYQSHMRSLEGALAANGSAASALIGVPPRRTLCIRQLASQDLSKLLNRPPPSRLRMAEGDGKEQEAMEAEVSSKSPPHLPIGLYFIAPSDWGVSPTLQTSLQDSQSLIFFDVIQSAVAIGKLWIRLDRASGGGAGGGSPRPSDQIASFFTLTAGNPSEVYICFESPDQRDQWLSSINLALKAELTRRHVGYASSVDDLAAVGSDDVTLADGRLPDTESLRSSLQRFAQENEVVVSQQRQKDRLSILSVYPEIRVPYDQHAEEAARRLEEFRGLSKLVERTLGVSSSAITTRGIRFQEGSPTVDSDTFLRSLLPDSRRQAESRRFLVTCLSLKTGLRASVEDANGAWQTDNPEPFFVTFFLASATDGVRLSEEFCWNPNSSLIDAMLPPELFRQLPWHSLSDASTAVSNGLPPSQRPTNGPPSTTGGGTKHAAPPPPIFKNPQGLITGNPAKLVRCRSALLSIDPHIQSSSLYLVFRVDKVLTGGISAAAEKYLKANGKPAESGDSPTASDMKAGTTLHKSMSFFCKYLGRYRMPFAWGAKSLFSRDTQVPLFRFDSGKVSETALLQNVQLLARLLSISGGSSFSNRGQPDVASMTPAVLETVERSLKAETLPIQLRVAVNELPFEVLLSKSLAGLMSPQLAPVRYSDGPSDKVLPLKQTVPNFSPDESVKELESFVSWRGRLATKPTSDPGDHSDAWTLQSIQSASIRSSLQLSDNKRDSIISSKSTTESVDSSSAAGGSLRFHLFGSTGGSLVSKTGSLERLKAAAGSTGGESKPTLFSRDLAGGDEVSLLGMINPYRGFQHSLYVYPQSLNLNIKHNFARARNLCCFIELRDNDSTDSQALKVFYTHPSPHRSLFDTWCNTSVVHHNSTPTFMDEAKLALPVVLTSRMHLLFRFYHVRCDLSPGDEKSASKKAIESPTGFAWLPLLQEDGNLLAGTFSLPISQDLPAGYLSSTDPNSQSSVRFIEPSHRGSVTSADGDVASAGRRTASRTEPSWLENKRPLFSVTLGPVSSIYTTDNHLARFFNTASTKLMLYTRVASNMNITPKGVRMVSAPEKTTTGAQLSPSRPTTITIQLSQLDITTGKLLCNSIKSLLLVEGPALLQFFPALANQLIEIILGAVAVGQQVLSVLTTSGNVDNRDSAWVNICQHLTQGSPGDLSKTAVGTLSVLLNSISSLLGFDNNIQKTTCGSNRPQLLKDYLEFSFDALKISSAFSELYGIQVRCNTGQGLTDRCPSVHHALVRAMLSLLMDYSCPALIAQRFLINIWFFYDLIIKSLAQTLTSSKRIKLDRKDPSRLPAAFITDLTLMLRLIGKWMAKICSLSNDAASGRATGNGSLYSGSGISSSATSTLSPDLVDSSKHTPGAQLASSVGINLAESTACFLQQLLSLVDRGFVLQRLRDLLAMLAIRHQMSAVEVDRFNSMRYQLLQCFCESEFFVQINLPSLSPSYRSDRRDEFQLKERFCQEHFVVGLVLQQVSCLLSGCADAGGWGAASSNHVHRQPLCLLRAQLAKLAFDARYAGSRQTQERICMLYLPLLRLSLENIAFLGPPGQSMKTAKTDFLRLRSNDRKNKEESKKSKSRTRTGKNGRGGGGSSAAAASVGEQSWTRPRSLVSAGSWESTVNPTISDSSNSSLSSVSLSSASVSLQKNAYGPAATGYESDDDGGGNSNSSNRRSASAQRRSNTGTSASSYVTPDGRVNPDVLNQIAGFSPGGPLQRVQWRRDGSIPKSPAAAVDDGLTVASRQQSGSTLTLTGPCDDDDANGTGGQKSLNWLDADNARAGRSAHNGGVEDDGCDYNSDVDEQDDLWADRVLELAGVIPNDSGDKPGYARQTSGLPPRPPRCMEALSQPPPAATTASSASTNPPSANGPQQQSLQNLEAQFSFAFRPHIHRRFMTAAGSQVARLPDRCQRDLYVCLLHLLCTLAQEPLTTLLHDLTSQDRVNFLLLLTYIVKHLKYRGRKCISRFNTISTSAVAQRGLAGTMGSPRTSTVVCEPVADDSEYKAILEANLSTEAGLIILDTLNLFTSTFKKELETGKPSNPLFQGIIDVYVCLLTSGQSETLLKHVFVSLRVFVSRFSKVLFSETTDGLASLCTVGLRVSNLNLLAVEEEEEDLRQQQQRLSFAPAGSLSPAGRPRLVFDVASANTLSALRLEACGLLYRLWRASFEVFSVRGFHRVHLQMIISLSKLVGNIGPEFETSLSLLHSLAEMDVQRAGVGGAYRERSVSPFAASSGLALLGNNGKQFLEDIDDLIKRIRTVLTATDEMRRHSDDPELLIDLQYSLAKSYASNPVLRRAWLEKLAESHLSLKNMAEVAMAKLHIAALMAEYLRKRGCLDSEFPQGCDAFCKISSNIRREETCQLADPSILELAYNQEDLLRDLADAAVALESAGLFEALQPVYALVTPVYEVRRDFLALSRIYHHLGDAYKAINDAESRGHRLFASYYRVTFFGKAFEGFAGKSFIYRTGPCQKLSVFIHSIMNVHTQRLGRNKVQLITDNYVSLDSLSPDKAYIQVTFVEPYVPETASDALTAFERQHDVRQFFFETPFIMQPGMSVEACVTAPGPRRTDDLTAQWLRRTTLTTEATFPHLRCRLEVTSTQDTDLSPLDAAIEAIQMKTRELSSHLSLAPRESPHSSLHPAQSSRYLLRPEQTVSGAPRVPLLLDMQLQGALLPTVNQGPMAYAHAFLSPENALLHPPAKVQRLKRLFLDFLTKCLALLTRYQHIMIQVHEEKYRAMREAFDKYRVDLSNLLKEEIVVDEARQVVCPKSEITC